MILCLSHGAQCAMNICTGSWWVVSAPDSQELIFDRGGRGQTSWWMGGCAGHAGWVCGYCSNISTCTGGQKTTKPSALIVMKLGMASKLY